MTLWDKILSSLQHKINRHSFNTWLKPTHQMSLADGTLQIEVPSLLFADWISRNYLPQIRESAREIESSDLQIRFMSRQAPATVRGAGNPGSVPVSGLPLESGTDGAGRHGAARPSGQAAPPQPAWLGTGLNPRYTFDSFVVSSCNNFAHAAAMAVAEQPSSAYNPLYVYGGVGLGKTHLMHAIGNRVLRSKGAVRHLYISTETFMNELINSIRFEKTLDFKERYRNVDVLLIDDIQFLAGKERTQEEFFHTFNALYESQKQIVITSDCPPRDIPTLEERLRSRFEWGLIADIQPPDLETKIAILKKKAEAENVQLPEDVAHFIAGRVRSNIRELEGSLIRLVAYASLTGRPIDLGMAQDTLKDLMDDRGRTVTIEAIQKFVAAYFKLRPIELKSRNNSKHISFPRQVAMYLCKKLTDKSLPAIGTAFGGKHHTTVLHAVRKIEAMRERDKEFARLVGGFMESFK
ncbi:MAG TPA: chromosomal replication initiator protein DnaA [Candidatus Polarisedimenticolia bacterium]|jgi:chromosomal replication initiator protein|nr:chromosomal replication initiator protein DnaA [Candidatus Polarisedimenticolia bacterium]